MGITNFTNTSFTNKKVALLGFGLEGRDVVRFLSGKSSDVTIFDKKPKEEIDTSGLDNDIKFHLGSDYLKEGLKNFDIIIRSPGVYRNMPEILEAEENGVEVTSAIEIFMSLCKAKVIGVTGTKGKGTTSTLIYEILKNSDKKVYLAGNIGKPFLELLNNLSVDSYAVMELSSFQLMDLTISPHIAVVLNITEDHLDWHKNREEYIEAKRNILSHQKESDFALINYDYETSKNFESLGNGSKYYFSTKEKVDGAYVVDNEIFLSFGDVITPLGSVSNLLLRGEHNWENIAAAAGASYLAGANIDSIRKTIFSFKGLEHRLELVREVKGVTFYNDSFATGPQPTIAAIRSFGEPATLVLGGRGKGLDYHEMAKEIVSRENIKTVFLIGELSEEIKQNLTESGFGGELIEMNFSPIEETVKKAYELTPKGGVVIFSPAATSFDMFQNYKDRGNKFKAAVEGLSE